MSTDLSLLSPRALLLTVAVVVALLGIGFGASPFSGGDQQPREVPANETALSGPQTATPGGGAGPQQPARTTPTVPATPEPETPAESTEPEPETDDGTGTSDATVSSGTGGDSSDSTGELNTPQAGGEPSSGVEGSTNASAQ